MHIEQEKIQLIPMTDDNYHLFFLEYENDPDVNLPGQEYVYYKYSEEKVAKYIQKQKDLKRIPLAILYDDEIVGEIIIKNIEQQKSATMSIVLKNTKYKDRGIGTQAERLAVQYVFEELDMWMVPLLVLSLRCEKGLRNMISKVTDGLKNVIPNSFI